MNNGMQQIQGATPKIFLKRSEEARQFPLLMPARDLDVGYDLYIIEDVVVEARKLVDIWHKVQIGLPDGLWAEVRARSSTRRNSCLEVIPCPIDSGYRGEVATQVENHGDIPVTIKKGERISQLVFHYAIRVEFDEDIPVDFEDTERGTNGMGSTG